MIFPYAMQSPGSFLFVLVSAAARPRHALALLTCVALAACGGAEDDGLTEGFAGAAGQAGTGAGGRAALGASGAGAGTGGSSAGGDAGAGACNLTPIESPPSSAAHLVQCSAVSYDTNPPSGGAHYAIWPAFQSYDFPLSAGYLVHALEHGAVVFWYNCPEGCADEVAEVEAFIAGLPEDPLCAGTGAARRTVLVPAPTLGSRWAASAWGYALTADCFDSAAFGAFYTDHYGRGPEALCNAGQAFTADQNCQ